MHPGAQILSSKLTWSNWKNSYAKENHGIWWNWVTQQYCKCMSRFTNAKQNFPVTSEWCSISLQFCLIQIISPSFCEMHCPCQMPAIMKPVVVIYPKSHNICKEDSISPTLGNKACEISHCLCLPLISLPFKPNARNMSQYTLFSVSVTVPSSGWKLIASRATSIYIQKTSHPFQEHKIQRAFLPGLAPL